MIIYLDALFIENIILDYIILKEVSIISKCKYNKICILFAAMISSVYVVLMVAFKLRELSYIIVKLLLILVVVYIAFKPNRITNYFKLMLFFLMVSAIYVGILIVTKSLLGLENNIFINEINKIEYGIYNS